jgi:hypothetical protein
MPQKPKKGERLMMPDPPSRPATLSDRLRQWLDYVNALPGRPVACDPEPELARNPDEVYFYRPGEVLVRQDSPGALTAVLDFLTRRDLPATVQRNIVTLSVSWDPAAGNAPTAPEVLKTLSAGLREPRRDITPNHVGFPAGSPVSPGPVTGAPWVNGGPGGSPESIPVGDPCVPWQVLPAAAPPSLQVAVFDTGLIPNQPMITRAWMKPVTGDGEVQYNPGGLVGLDLFDCHGLFVAGVLACAAPNSQINVVDVYEDNGSVDEVALAKKINDYLQNHSAVRVVNVSGGMHTNMNIPPADLSDVIGRYLGVLFVAAAGNHVLPPPPVNAARPFYPAAFGVSHNANPIAKPNVIGVGATDSSGAHRDFSNEAPSAQVWAHGFRVIGSFKPGQLYLPPVGSPPITITTTVGTALWSGTSFAAPLVAGVLTGYVAGLNGAVIDNAIALQWILGNPTGAPIWP